MLVQRQRGACRARRLAQAEDDRTLRAELPACDQLVNRPTRAVGRVDLDERFGPVALAGVRAVDELANVVRPQTGEAATEAGVLAD